jgi:hypothetical protein
MKRTSQAGADRPILRLIGPRPIRQPLFHWPDSDVQSANRQEQLRGEHGFGRSWITVHLIFLKDTVLSSRNGVRARIPSRPKNKTDVIFPPQQKSFQANNAKIIQAGIPLRLKKSTPRWPHTSIVFKFRFAYNG